MIEHYFSRTSVLTRLRHGLLGPYLDELATTLQQQGYVRDSIRHYLRACDQFGQWLTHQGYAAQEVNEALAERYLSGLPRRPAGRQPPNLAIVVFTNLGSEADLICKPQLRPVTTPKYCEAVSRNPINKAFTYDDLLRCYTVDLDPQFRKGNFDAVCQPQAAEGLP